MGTVLLISADRRMIAEFEAISAATGVNLHVSTDHHDTSAADAVFIDAATGDVELQHRNVTVVTLSPPGPAAWALAARIDAVRIAELPADREWVASHVHVPETARGTVVALHAAVGGAGCSTLAIALAHHVARRGHRTAVVDLDANGGLDIAAGLESESGPRWPDVDLAALHGVDLAQWLPHVGDVAVLSSDLRRPRAEMDLSVVEALAQTCDVVIVDVPTAAGGLVAELAANFRCTVLPNTVRAVAVAGRCVASVGSQRHGLVVRSVAGAGLDALAVGEVLDTPVWAALPSDPRIVEQIEQGLGPSMINLGGYTRAVMHLANRILGDDAAADS